jgi:(E)-4-hydroxy-3-methylbut-2-enyl-diphosphate synthase
MPHGTDSRPSGTDSLDYRRFPTRLVKVGDVALGGDAPIVIQSMTISDTLDVESTVREIAGLVRAGCPLVRVTCPSVREADALADIKKALHQKRVKVPLIADIHFTPNAALRAADLAEKVRINPGNYADRKKFAVFEISDAEYEAELERIHDRFKPLVLKLKENGVALRIGSNHGSLSDRILNRYGDTPEGMVESALEFVRICRDYNYHNIVLSMKSSVARVAIEANRLLVERMIEEEMDYPIHLGVTEAGAGLPARIKSAMGIGGLLSEGIGDTIRVSLTEPSINEIEACRQVLLGVARSEPKFIPYLTDDLTERLQVAEPMKDSGGPAPAHWTLPRPVAFGERRTVRELNLGSIPLGGSEGTPIRVHFQASHSVRQASKVLQEFQSLLDSSSTDLEGKPEALWVRGPLDASRVARIAGKLWEASLEKTPLVLRSDFLDGSLPSLEGVLPLLQGVALLVSEDAPAAAISEAVQREGRVLFWEIEDPETAVPLCKTSLDAGLTSVGVLLPDPGLRKRAWDVQRRLSQAHLSDRVHVIIEAQGTVAERSLVAGPTLLETTSQAILVGAHASEPDPALGEVSPVATAYGILQACRLRLTRAEFISCPSCGRTQFDLETTTERIRQSTGHLKGVKIAVMGCIVNGPGEMADADFGYVGSGLRKVDLYKGHTRVRKNLSPEEADEALVQLIKDSGRWVDP